MTRDEALKLLKITKAQPSRDEVNSAYREAVKRYHPDQHPNADPISLEAIRELFERVQAARALLLEALNSSNVNAHSSHQERSARQDAQPQLPPRGIWSAHPNALHEVREYQRFMARRQFKHALIHIENALRELPQDYELFKMHSDVLSELNREHAIEGEIAEWELRFPGLKRDYEHRLLLFAVLRTQGKHPHALNVISEMIEREGEVPALLTHKALTLIELGHGKQADVIIDRLKHIDPNNPLVKERSSVMLVGDQFVDKKGAAQDACFVCLLLECIFDCL